MYDLHTDLLTAKGLNKKQKQEYIDAMIRGGHKAVLAIFTHDEADPVNLRGLRVGIEDCSAFCENQILQYNPVYCSLTWNYDNALAGGCKGDSGLTQNGADVIRFLNTNGIILDLAHINRTSFFQAAERAERVMVSHTCFSSVFSHARNICDDQIRVISERNGLVGLTLVRGFLCDKIKATIHDLFAHLDYFCSKFDYHSLSVGTDFFGTDNGVEGLDCYDDFDKFKLFLQQKGYSDEVIDCIFNKNAHDFFNNGKVGVSDL